MGADQGRIGSRSGAWREPERERGGVLGLATHQLLRPKRRPALMNCVEFFLNLAIASGRVNGMSKNHGEMAFDAFHLLSLESANVPGQLKVSLQPVAKFLGCHGSEDEGVIGSGCLAPVLV